MKIADLMAENDPQGAAQAPVDANAMPTNQSDAPNQAAQEAPGAAQADPNANRRAPDDEGLAAEYERVVTAGASLIHSEETRDGILNLLQGGAANPEGAVVDAARLIILQLDEKSGKTIPAPVVIPAAIEIMEELANLGVQAGIWEFDNAMVQRAGVELMKRLADDYDISEEEIQAFMEEQDPEVIQQSAQQMASYYPEFAGAQNGRGGMARG